MTKKLTAIENGLGVDITANVDQESFNLAINILTVYTTTLLTRFDDGQKVADALIETVRSITDTGEDSVIALVTKNVVEAFNPEPNEEE